jgi:EamA domain-containing membrane protein RarD
MCERNQISKMNRIILEIIQYIHPCLILSILVNIYTNPFDCEQIKSDISVCIPVCLPL